jgi:DNA-binding XRE family transcriptional regulator
MSTVHERLREARREAGYRSAAAAAAALGVNYQTYAGAENGKAGLRPEVAARYARKFRVNLEWLLTSKGPKRPGGPTTMTGVFGLPILGKAQAGQWFDSSLRDPIPPEELPRLPVLPDERVDGEQYVLQVEGDSLDLIVPDGGYVVCVEFSGLTGGLRDGLVCHVERHRDAGQLVEVTLKVVERRRGAWWLVPKSSNPKWQGVRLGESLEAADEVAVRGIVVGVYQRLLI